MTFIYLNMLTNLIPMVSSAEMPDPCFPSPPCGLNTECEAGEEGEPVCNCLPGFQLIEDSDPLECEEGGGLGLVDDIGDYDEETPSPTPASTSTPAPTLTPAPTSTPTSTPCFLPAGTKGSCVPVSKCPSMKEFLTSFKEGALTHDVKLLLKQSLFCPNKEGREICCPNTKKTGSRDFCQLQNGDHAICVQLTACSPFMELMAGLKRPANGSLVPNFIRSAFLCGAANGLDGEKHARICCPGEALKTLPEPTGYAKHAGRRHLAPGDHCGMEWDGYKGNIVGGKEAKPGQFPWLANLGYRTGGSLSYRCGGTIIGKRLSFFSFPENTCLL